MVIYGYMWLYVVICGYILLYMVVYGYIWSYMVLYGYSIVYVVAFKEHDMDGVWLVSRKWMDYGQSIIRLW